MSAAQFSFEIAIPNELSDANLHEALQSSIHCEMRLVGYIVELIREIDSRRLYLEYGCTSLFSYLTDIAGYTAGPAQARIDAARLMNDVPTIADDLRDGSINLTQVSIVAQSIRQKAKEASQAKPSAQEKRELFEAIKTCSIVQSQRVVAEKLDIEIKTYERKTTQKDGSLRAEMTFSLEEQKQINRLKELLSHALPGATIQQVLMAAAADYLKRKDPLTKSAKAKVLKDSDEARTAGSAVLSNSRSTSALKITAELEVTCSESGGSDGRALRVDFESELPAQNSLFTTAEPSSSHPVKTEPRSHISRPVARSIYQRDRCCQWHDRKSGKICGSRFQLQIDHIQPVWAGGANGADNLQILCAPHNRMKYRNEASIRPIR